MTNIVELLKMSIEIPLHATNLVNVGEICRSRG